MKPSAEIDLLFERFGVPVVAVDSAIVEPAPAAPLTSPSRRPTVTSLAGPLGLLSREELPVVVTVAPNVSACALCRGALGTKRVECASCRASVHPGCARASGGCPSIGCAQRRARRAARSKPQTPKTGPKSAPKAASRTKPAPAPSRELQALALTPALPHGGAASSLADRLSLVGLFACLVTLLSCTACVAVVAAVRLANMLGSA